MQNINSLAERLGAFLSEEATAGLKLTDLQKAADTGMATAFVTIIERDIVKALMDPKASVEKRRKAVEGDLSLAGKRGTELNFRIRDKVHGVILTEASGLLLDA